jgi:hypothetical protein
MEKREEPWYVGRRAELLALQFLQELGASIWAVAEGAKDRSFDAIASFLTKDQQSRIAAIEVKSTQQPVGKEFRFQENLKYIRASQHSNVPVLFLVVDVKQNQVYYGWARDIRYAPSPGNATQAVRCTLPVVPAADRREQLLDAIFSQPESSERAGAG